MIFLRQKYKEKPKQWGPISYVGSNASNVSNLTGIHKPIGFWPFWDAAGSVASDVITDKNGTLYGPDWSSGRLNFSSVDSDYLSLSDHASFFDGYPTGTIIINFTASSLNTLHTLFSLANPSETNEYCVVYVGAGTASYDDESANFAYRNGAVSEMNLFVRNGNQAYLDGKEHTIAVVIDGIDNAIYIDGVKQNTWALTGSKTNENFTNFASSATDMRLGERLLNSNGTVVDGRHLDGSIGYVKIFDTPLTSSQVTEEYDNPYGLIQPPTYRTYFDLAEIVEKIIPVTTGAVTITGIDVDVSASNTTTCTTGTVTISGLNPSVSIGNDTTMASYFSGTKVADYTTTELSVTPQKVMVEDGQKNQVVHEFDDGTISVVTLSDIFFDVTLQWDYVDDSDKSTIIDMYYNSSKADGSKNTFYWQHPRENQTYVARFLTNPKVQLEGDKPNGFVIPSVELRIEGVKAMALG